MVCDGREDRAGSLGEICVELVSLANNRCAFLFRRFRTCTTASGLAARLSLGYRWHPCQRDAQCGLVLQRRRDVHALEVAARRCINRV